MAGKHFKQYEHKVTTTRYLGKVKSQGAPRPEKIPTSIYGHHSSFGGVNVRYWSFQSKEGYDRFCNDFRAYVVTGEAPPRG